MADITLRAVDPARDGDIEFLWQLLVERSAHAEMNISHQRMPSMREHIAYVDRHPYRAWYIVERRFERIGMVCLTHQNEIGVHIIPEHRGGGWGREAVKRITKLHTPLPAVPGTLPGSFVANVNPANVASRALFESLGGIVIQHTYLVPQPGEDHGEGERETKT